MKQITEKDILHIIEQDAWMMDVLRTVRSLDLPDWWIEAGFVRNKIWDVLHGYTTRTPLNDVDVIYFDNQNIGKATEKEFEKLLKEKKPDVPWSVKNQARMAVARNDGTYKNASDGLSRWVETATCTGVRLGQNNKLVLTAPHGIDDLVHLILRPGPAYATKLEKFYERIKEKHWIEQWPKLHFK
jgi:hypothetical protein